MLTSPTYAHVSRTNHGLTFSSVFQDLSSCDWLKPTVAFESDRFLLFTLSASAGYEDRGTEMEILRTVHIFVKSLFVLLLCSVGDGRESELNYVTCGSLVKLLNTKHNVRLHSHDVKYGSGNFTFTIYIRSITPTRAKDSSPTQDIIQHISGEIPLFRSLYQISLNEKETYAQHTPNGTLSFFCFFFFSFLCVCR